MHSLERIGRYHLERPLGTGAFATVWLAHDPELHAPVAVKVLAENWAHRLDIRERFLSEARLLRRAGSSRVVQVYDIGDLPDGRPYFVMEYADGGTLADLLASGPLAVSDALVLTAEAARSAAALHEAGIVHRDIKPTNVLLHTAPDGTRRVLLADLGLAKSLAQASGLTLAAGSAGYQPPEQAQPSVGIDERADVYSLGAVGYELLTGTVPGPPGKTVPPGRLRPEVGEPVERALLRALEPDRARRWPGAQAFAQELDRLAAGLSAQSTRRLDGVRGRLSTVTLALAAILTAASAAVATTVVIQRGSTVASETRVSDATGRVTLRVPADWGRALRDSGWNPHALGLATGHEPGLVIADDLTRWSDLRAAVNGVFVGVSEHGDVTARVRDLAHPDCHYSGSRTFAGADWHGLVRAWSGCPDGGSVTESALTPAGSSQQPQVYVQVRQQGADDATEGVLRSLQVT
ncbi:serine/threonine protein kinase [Streptomyces pluripotens]|uniref:non-specific serine/threonine protein kinase n=1 Tax=Streptomyces pluripotens TaxID=1355015 RepID=A0A221NSU3_9ACTN|nr:MULTISPECIES: serine/threonine-protein kinase [Streptomyces]ARP68775.1 serine/threonine protein kinase [Streptomyces pluripotens]ASN23031.1 serine/threonine protein kinase [Streptomyces pluripotens]MCH0558492.1 serine/threonine protein kinase [Streptomyces sp. MUM 16J]